VAWLLREQPGAWSTGSRLAGSPLTIDAILRQLASAEWDRRVDAVNKLAAIDDEKARAALVTALYDPDGAVTQAAAEAMMASGDLRYVEPLLEALKQASEPQADVVWDVLCFGRARQLPTKCTARSTGG
jgi:HEAT repeat protein